MADSTAPSLIGRSWRSRSAVDWSRVRNDDLTTTLHPLGVDHGRTTAVVDGRADLVAAFKVDVFHIERVEIAREETETRQAYVNA